MEVRTPFFYYHEFRKAVIEMFNNPYYGGMQASQAWQPRMPQMQPQMPAYMGEIIKVNGQAGAQSLRLAPNSGVIAMDTTAPIVWLCQADGAGYFTPEPFSIAPYQVATPENDFEKRLTRLEGIILGSESDDGAAQPRRRRATAEQSADE